LISIFWPKEQLDICFLEGKKEKKRESLKSVWFGWFCPWEREGDLIG
jgi:hypothetical protein